MVLATAQTVTGAKTFNDSKLLLRNPADTFSYTVVPSAITAARSLTLPLTTQTETLAVQPSNGTATNLDPSGTTSTTGVMMGLAVAFTPRVTGRMMAFMSGQCTNGTGDNGFSLALRYGIGSAPANGNALTGTIIGATVDGSTIVSGSGTGTPVMPCSHQGAATGLTVGTAYWIDTSLAALVGGTATMSNVNVTVIEF